MVSVSFRQKTQKRQSQCHEPASGTSLLWLLRQPALRNGRVNKHIILLQGDERTDCFTGTTSSTAAACFDAVLLKVGIVGVARTWVHICLGIVVRALILILDKQTDGGAESETVFCARLEMNKVFLITLLEILLERGKKIEGWTDWCGQVALTRAATAELRLYIFN